LDIYLVHKACVRHRRHGPFPFTVIPLTTIYDGDIFSFLASYYYTTLFPCHAVLNRIKVPCVRQPSFQIDVAFLAPSWTIVGVAIS
jgi:hypothetical protein